MSRLVDCIRICKTCDYWSNSACVLYKKCSCSFEKYLRYGGGCLKTPSLFPEDPELSTLGTDERKKKMGCKGNKKKSKVVYDINAQRTPQRIEQQRIIKPSGPTDYHCPECGFVLTGRKQGTICHRCSSQKYPENLVYQELRQKECGNCIHNIDNVCVQLKEIHPERECKVDVGIKMPEAACPLSVWGKVGIICKECNALTFDGHTKPTKCKYCGVSV